MTSEAISPGVKGLVGAALFFALMPYIGISALATDNQPTAFMICALGTFLMHLGGKFRLPYITVPVWVMTCVATVSLVARATTDGIAIGELLRAYFGYLSAPIVLGFFIHYLRYLDDREIARVVDVVLFVTFAGFVLNAIGLSFVTQAVVNRALFRPGEGLRGLTSFFSEQSGISIQMAFCFFLYAITGTVTRMRTALLVIASLLSAAGQVFIVVLQVSLAYGAAVLIMFVVRSRVTAKAFTRIGLVMTGFVVFVLLHEPIIEVAVSAGLPRRGLTVVAALLKEGPAFIGRDPGGAVFKISGVLHTAATVVDNPTNFALAATSERAKFRASISRTYSALSYALFTKTALLAYPPRPYSALGTWVIEFGLIGLVACLGFLSLLLLPITTAARTRQVPLMWSALYLVQVFFILVPLANPSLWLLSAAIWRSTERPTGAAIRPAPGQLAPTI